MTQETTDAPPEFFAQADKDTWQTPPWFVNGLADTLGGIDTDPCAGPNTEIGDRRNYRIEDDGLSRAWHGTVFVNMPYSEKWPWILKAEHEYEQGAADRVLVLVPDSTDVKSWYHDGCARSDYRWFKRGRMSFIDPETGDAAKSPTNGIMLAIWGEIPEQTKEWLRERGDLVKSV